VVLRVGVARRGRREQGTVEHLLVMPVVPAEIMLPKILANGLVILAAAELSLLLVVQWWLQVPIAGSTLLFLFGACFYVFTVAALGILLGTVAATMGQFGLLAIPVLLVMMLLSGGTTPMPVGQVTGHGSGLDRFDPHAIIPYGLQIRRRPAK
jgi:ABC-2 type transport system permease protein